MRLLRGIFNFYINSSIHVALAICALVAITAFEFDLEVTNVLWGFIFFGSITGYNFVKYATVAGLHHRTLAASLKTIQVFSFVAFAVMLYCLVQLSFSTIGVVAVFGMLTLLYAVPVLKHKNLRTFGGIKIMIVALVWSGVTVFVPIVADEMSLDSDSWITFFQRILLVTVLILPFEIRDLPFDSPDLKTLPQQVGIRNTKITGTLFLLCILILYGFKDTFSWSFLAALCIVCVCMGFALWVSKKEQSRYFAAFWVEGIPILWFGVLFWLRHFFL